MIADLKPYAEYKESGLPWLGRVPEHWEVQRLKNWVTINRHNLGEDTPADLEFDYLDIGSVTTGRLAKRPVRLRFVDAPSRARRVLQSGDTIVSTVRTYLKAVLTVNECGQPLVASTGFAVLSPRADTTPRCLGYVAQSEAFTNQVTAESVGIAYPAISETRLGNIAVTLPPPSEQAASVRFLDWANGRLERAIRAKRKVIALLNEQKQAIIHRAVTRGLYPSVPLKPSGIHWLGDIPQHWEVRKLRQLLSRVTERNRPDLPLLSVVREKGVIERDTEDRDGNHNFIPEDLSNYKVVRCGQFAMNKMKAWQGSYGVSQFDGIVSPAYFVFDLREVSGAFFHTAIRSKAYVPFFTQASDGVRVGQWDLAESRMKEISFFFPSATEQLAIVESVTGATTGISVAISRLEREIELLREYRTRLVADVVTGKLDVCEAALRLPDEAPLDSVEDDADLGDETEAADEEAPV